MSLIAKIGPPPRSIELSAEPRAGRAVFTLRGERGYIELTMPELVTAVAIAREHQNDRHVETAWASGMFDGVRAFDDALNEMINALGACDADRVLAASATLAELIRRIK
jgi:hypothetical protein